jgi:hypothetical protein
MRKGCESARNGAAYRMVTVRAATFVAGMLMAASVLISPDAARSEEGFFDFLFGGSRRWEPPSHSYEHPPAPAPLPPLVDLVRKLGSRNLPEAEPTTLSAMAYEIARGVLEQYPIMQRIEIRLTHFSRGLEVADEAQDNHVVNLVLQR